jgi:hypothetical protein
MEDLISRHKLWEKPNALAVYMWVISHGESMVTRHTFGLSRQLYRTAISYLSQKGLITTKITTKGSVLAPVYIRAEGQSVNRQEPSREPTNQHSHHSPPYILNVPPLYITKKTTSKKVARSDTARSLAESEFNKSFWPNIRNKKSVAAARKAYVQLRLQNKTEMVAEDLAELYNQHLDSARDKQYAKHPSTWINQECWLDDTETETTDHRYESDKDRVIRLGLMNKYSRWVKGEYPEMTGTLNDPDYAFNVYLSYRGRRKLQQKATT